MTMNFRYLKTVPGYLKLLHTLLGFLSLLMNIIVFCRRNIDINGKASYYPLYFGWELFFHIVIGGFFITTSILILSNLVFEGVSPFELFHNGGAVIFLLIAAIGMLVHINSDELIAWEDEKNQVNRPEFYKTVSAYALYTTSSISAMINALAYGGTTFFNVKKGLMY